MTSGPLPAAAQSSPRLAPGDMVLVRQALSGDPTAIEEVLARLACIVKFVFRLNRTQGHGLPTEALEDVVQQVYAALAYYYDHFESVVAGLQASSAIAEGERVGSALSRNELLARRGVKGACHGLAVVHG